MKMLIKNGVKLFEAMLDTQAGHHGGTLDWDTDTLDEPQYSDVINSMVPLNFELAKDIIRCLFVMYLTRVAPKLFCIAHMTDGYLSQLYTVCTNYRNHGGAFQTFVLVAVKVVLYVRIIGVHYTRLKWLLMEKL